MPLNESSFHCGFHCLAHLFPARILDRKHQVSGVWKLFVDVWVSPHFGRCKAQCGWILLHGRENNLEIASHGVRCVLQRIPSLFYRVQYNLEIIPQLVSRISQRIPVLFDSLQREVMVYSFCVSKRQSVLLDCRRNNLPVKLEIPVRISQCTATVLNGGKDNLVVGTELASQCCSIIPNRAQHVFAFRHLVTSQCVVDKAIVKKTRTCFKHHTLCKLTKKNRWPTNANP